MENELPVALVTGAGQGVGAAIAARLAADGYRLCVTAESGLECIENHLKKLDRLALSVVADLSIPGEVREIVTEVTRLTGRLDVLVNNAGRTFECPIEDCTDSDFDSLIGLNLKTPWIAAQSCVPVMRKNGGGTIVNISSIHARLTQPGYSLYAASKGGLSALTRQMAVELAPYGIRVNGVEPGLIRVPRTERTASQRTLRRFIPADRAGEPQEVAHTVSWLVAPGAGFVTGAMIAIDGGASARMVLGETN
jgi:NAD(P)-dependent dehydrogenase (short-subunit alcohol dehydrogenase family)